VRRFLLALASAVVLLGLGLALAAYNVDAWVNANRDAIAKRVSLELGREVSFGEVGVSLRGGFGVRVADLAVAADPAFSKDPLLRASALEVRIRILPALRSRIEVDQLVLRSPEITVIRTAQGLSTASLGGRPGEAAPAQKPGEPSAPGALLVAFVEIADGTLRFVDRRSRPPVETVATHLDFRASDVAPGAPVSFEVEAAVLGAARQNLRATGRVDPADEPSVDVEIEIASLDLAKALASAPLAGSKPEGLAGSGSGRLSLRAKGIAADLALEASIDARDAELRFGDRFAKPRGQPLSLALSGRHRAAKLEIDQGELVSGETRLALKGSVEDLAKPRMRMRFTSPAARPASFGAGDASDLLRDLALDTQLSFPDSGPKLSASLRSRSGSLRGVEYGGLALEARMDRGRVDVSKLSLDSFGGQVVVTGSADLRAPGAPTFDGRIEVQGADVARLLAGEGAAGPPRASGSLDAQIALRGAGASWDAIAPTLVGGGDLRVSDGVLRGFNPAGEALRALVELPILSGRKLGRLFETHPQVFGAEDTPFEGIDARLEIAGGELVARDARLVAKDYDVVAKGRFLFEGRIDSSAVMAFSRELSDAVVDAEKKLRFLRSREGRVELPVLIDGPPGDIDVDPDLAYVASSVSREAMGDVVDRVLVGKPAAPDESAGPPPDGEGEARPPASVEDVGRDLLRRGLGGLLKGKPKE
jgi:uncharacterized protein involved in outer membrane biogenesis